MKRSDVLVVAAMLAMLALCVPTQAALVGVDIGNPAWPGDHFFDGSFEVVTGAGADIWGTSDEFYFVQEEVLGTDFVLTARVNFSFFDPAQPWQKAGLMIRDSLDADSKHAFSLSSYASGFSYQGRTATGAASVSDTTPGVAGPTWLRLERIGDIFEASYSGDITDDVTQVVWSDPVSRSYEADPMAGSVFVGMAVTSHDVSLTTTADFWDYRLTGDVGQVATLTWDEFGDGNWGDVEFGFSRWLGGSETTSIPDALAHAVINSDTVTVAADRSATDLTINSGGLVIALGNSLTLGDRLDVALGSSVTMGPRTTLTVGGGQVSSLATSGAATIITSGPMTIGAFSDSGAAGLITKSGAGALQLGSIDNTNVAIGPAATVEVAEGTLGVQGSGMQAGQLVLSGGTFSFSDSITPGTATDGAVGTWKFDEGAGTTTMDSSGFNDGTLWGGAEWVEGVDGTALQFNGSDGYVSTNYEGVLGAASRTVSAWIKTTSSANSGIVAWGDSNSDGTKWHVRVNDNAAGALRTEVQGGNIIGTTSLIDGQWHHIAAVLDADADPNNTEVLLYVDGQLETISGSTDEPINTLLFDLVTIGRRTQTTSQGYFDGTVDEVNIYEFALSATEVADSFGSRSTPNFSSMPVLVTTDATIESQSHSAATFGTLTMESGVLTTTGQSPISFAGTSIPNTGGSVTVGFDPQVATDYGTIDANAGDVTIAKAGPSTWHLTATPINAGGLKWQVEDGVLLVDDSVSLAGQPITVVGGHLRADTLAGSTIDVSQTVVVDEVDPSIITITPGRLQTHSLAGADLTLSGGILTLVDKATAPGAAPTGPVGNWKFDETSGDNAVNSGTLGAAHDGVLTSFIEGDSRWVDGIDGGALHFEGTGWVNGGVIDPLVVDLAAAYTVALWAKDDSLVEEHQNDSVFTSGPANPEAFQMDFSSAVGGNYRWHSGINVRMGPIDTDWVHVAVTFDGTTVSTYYNGQYVASGDHVAEFTDFFIGRNRNGDRTFDGTIDDVYVYDRLLEPAEIATMAGTFTAADVTGVSPLVTADSIISSASGSALSFGTLRLESGSLTTTGDNPISFDGTQIVSTTPGAVVGFDPRAETDYGVIDAMGADVTITKTGPSTWVVDTAPLNIGSADFQVDGGLLQLEGTNTLGGQPIAVTSGTLEIVDLTPLGNSPVELGGGTLRITGGETGPASPDGLIAHYSFDNTHDPGYEDSGNNFNGVAVGDPTYVAEGVVGGAYAFDGDGDGVNINNGGSFLKDATSARTVSLWFNQTDSTGEQMLFDEGGTTNGLGLQLNSGLPNGMIQSASVPATSLVVAVLEEGWHHIAMVYGDSNMTIYLDGEAKSTVAVPFAELAAHSNNPGIGYRNAQNPFVNSQPFMGLIDEVHLFDTALDQAGIDTLIANTSFEPTAWDLTALDLTVTADSTLDAGIRSSINYGTLTLQNGLLTTTGAPEGFNFAGTVIDAAADAVVGIDARVDTDLGPITADGVTPVTVSKTGPGSVVLSRAPADLQALTFQAAGGQLVALGSSTVNPLDSATIGVAPGGDFVLASSEEATDVTFNNAVTATGGTLTAGAGRVGAAGPLTATVSGPVTIQSGTLSLQSTGLYSLNVTGNITGSTLDMVAGDVSIAGTDVATLNVSGGTLHAASTDVASLNILGGTLHATGDLGVGVLQQTGGVLNLDGNNLIVSDHLVLGDTTLAIAGGSFKVGGSDLANAPQLTLTGGELTIHTPISAPQDNLLGEWKFDDGGGNTAVNSAGSTIPDGTLTNFPGDDSQWVAGYSGGALDFDGNNDRVIMTGYDGVTGTQSRSMAAWIKGTKNNAGIMSFGANSGGQKWNFRVQDGNGTAGAIRVEVNGGYVVGSTDVRDDQWHHVAAVFPEDGSPNVNDVLLYVDGVLEVRSATRNRSINTAASQDFRIGHDHSNRDWDGLIDEVYLYDRALSVGEINQLIDVANGGPGDIILPEATIIAATDSTLNLDTTKALLGSVGAADGATLTLLGPPRIDVNELGGAGTITGADLNVLETLHPGNVPESLRVEGSVTLAASATYSATIGSASDTLTTGGDITLGDAASSPALAFNYDGASPFMAGTYTLLSAEGEDGILNQFGDIESLGAYVTGTGVSYNGPTVTLTIDKNLHPGDADLSAATDLSDFNIWNANKFTSGTGWTAGDFNADGQTDLSDFNIWNANKFTVATGGAAPAPTQVPEPGTLAMLAAGLLGLLLWRRRRAA